MDTLVLHSEKGGVGKTTLAGLIAAAATADGQRVTAVDLDPRGTLTRLLGVADTYRPGYSTDAILAAEEPAGWGAQLRVPSPWNPDRLHVIPGERGLGNREEAPAPDMPDRLARALAGVRSDLLLVDTPPRPGGPLVRAALELPRARVLWAATPDQDGLDGVAHGWETLAHIRTGKHARAATALGIAVTRYDGRTTDARRVIAEFARIYGPLLLEPAIPERVIVREARAADESPTLYSPEIHERAGQLWHRIRERLAAPEQLKQPATRKEEPTA